MSEETNIFLKHFRNEVIPMIQKSYFIAAIITDNLDSKLCLEIGAAVLLDKPIVVITSSKTLVSESLREIALEIILIKDWNNDEEVQKAIDEFLDKYQEKTNDRSGSTSEDMRDIRRAKTSGSSRVPLDS